jgi:hypothetical protein
MIMTRKKDTERQPKKASDLEKLEERFSKYGAIREGKGLVHAVLFLNPKKYQFHERGEGKRKKYRPPFRAS